jgi:hypothetical protein
VWLGVARSAKEHGGRLLIRWSLVRFQPGEPFHYFSIQYKLFQISFVDQDLRFELRARKRSRALALHRDEIRKLAERSLRGKLTLAVAERSQPRVLRS